MKAPSSVRHGSPAQVILFMRPYEELENKQPFQTEQTRATLYKNPYALSQKIINNTFKFSDTPDSLYVLFEGFVDTVKQNQAHFPRLTQDETINLIVTRRIHPVVLQGNTVQFLVRDTNTEIAYYQLTRCKDETANFYYWEITALPIPQDKKIPSNALIIFAEPEHIYVPTEPVATIGGPHLILPVIYTKRDLEKNYDALKFLTINRYFSPIHHLVQVAPPKRYAQIIDHMG